MKFFKKTINDVPLDGHTVLLRADYNVPLKPDGTIADDFRIRASLPTLKALLNDDCKVVIVSHLGRPEGKPDVKLSLEPVALRLAELLGQPVHFVSSTIGDKPRLAIKRAPKGSVVVLENLRFYAGEEANDEAFARELVKASGARYVVQDGFGVVHRAHASTSAITQLLPSVAGLLLQREYTTITKAMKSPDHPLVAVLGGAKVSDKVGVITALMDIADTVIVTGAPANTFLVYKGISIGKSKYEPGMEEVIKEIYAKAEAKVGKEKVDDFIILPTDLAVDRDGKRVSVPVDKIGPTDHALDIGDDSIEHIVKVIESAKTVIWNGTLGVAEMPNFAHGSARVALALATHPEITSIIGGGDTSDFVLDWDSRKGASFTHVSTGGGASLELMAGEKLPGVESLLNK